MFSDSAERGFQLVLLILLFLASSAFRGGICELGLVELIRISYGNICSCSKRTKDTPRIKDNRSDQVSVNTLLEGTRVCKTEPTADHLRKLKQWHNLMKLKNPPR